MGIFEEAPVRLIAGSQPDTYLVKSSDGSREYTVKDHGKPEDAAADWECSCPAGIHGLKCKHVRQVQEFIQTIMGENPDGTP